MLPTRQQELSTSAEPFGQEWAGALLLGREGRWVEGGGELDKPASQKRCRAPNWVNAVSFLDLLTNDSIMCVHIYDERI